MHVQRIPLTQASPEGENSAYCLPTRGLLVDPGPPGDDSWAELTAGLDAAGLALDDLDHVFVTHWHADHAGNATRLADAADATLHLHADDAPLVGDYARARAERVERDAAWLVRWGVPTDVVETLRAGDRPSSLPDTYPVETHEDGERVAGLRVVHTPGHTVGHAALAGEGHLFAGDSLLPTYTPNAGGSDTRLRDAVSVYLDTLERLLDAEWTDGREPTVHPGHGAAAEFPERAEHIRNHQHDRSKRVRGVVDEAGPVTPWTVANALFGDLRAIHVKMGAGEAAAHLERLDRLGVIDRVDDDPRTYVPA